MNICLCGTSAGFPHSLTCPWPYFGNDPKRIETWELAQKLKEEEVSLHYFVAGMAAGQTNDEGKQ